MAKQFVEFYFPGIDVAGKEEREVAKREPALVEYIPQYAFAFRFFEKEEDGKKVNFSGYFYRGTEYSIEEFAKKFPVYATDVESDNCNKVVKLITGGFRPLHENDIVL